MLKEVPSLSQDEKDLLTKYSVEKVETKKEDKLNEILAEKKKLEEEKRRVEELYSNINTEENDIGNGVTM